MSQSTDDRTRADGDFAAAVYDQHATALLRYVRGLLPNDPHRAEDVVQECVLRAWRNETALAAQRNSVRPWLFRVARNLVVDWSRRDRVRPLTFGDDDFDLLPGPADFADQVVRRCVVDQALSGLTPTHHQALRQVYHLDRTRQRAATAIGVPVGTVKSRVHHATIAVAEALAGCGVTAAEW
ncbi:sigma-70 family RNA polymerase sigma factor [Actinosynnema sp. NPDC023587]|uniref:sigma-70 family RNA polymerase sigma factor n=1 Tax=Actinosynnema sp. NPDC023587 TaxID=3154695 RepID=UPI0034013A83